MLASQGSTTGRSMPVPLHPTPSIFLVGNPCPTVLNCHVPWGKPLGGGTWPDYGLDVGQTSTPKSHCGHQTLLDALFRRVRTEGTLR